MHLKRLPRHFCPVQKPEEKAKDKLGSGDGGGGGGVKWGGAKQQNPPTFQNYISPKLLALLALSAFRIASG